MLAYNTAGFSAVWQLVVVMTIFAAICLTLKAISSAVWREPTSGSERDVLRQRASWRAPRDPHESQQSPGGC